MLKSWRLLEELHPAIAYHLEPSKATDQRREAAILHVAVQIADAMQPNTATTLPATSIERSLEHIAIPATLLGLDPDSLASLPAEIETHAKEIFQTIRPGATFIS